jgi:hypothetical protein
LVADRSSLTIFECPRSGRTLALDAVVDLALAAQRYFFRE